MSMALIRSTSPPSPPDGGRSAGAGADLAESSAVGVGGGRGEGAQVEGVGVGEQQGGGVAAVGDDGGVEAEDRLGLRF